MRDKVGNHLPYLLLAFTPVTHWIGSVGWATKPIQSENGYCRTVFWWSCGDSNSRHPHCKCGALPTELQPRAVLGAALQSVGFTFLSRPSLYYLQCAIAAGIKKAPDGADFQPGFSAPCYPVCAMLLSPENVVFICTWDERINMCRKYTMMPPLCQLSSRDRLPTFPCPFLHS